MSQDDCIFCKIASGEFGCSKIYEDESILVFLDIRPVSDGHALVIPKQHFARLDECPADVLEKMSSCAGRVAKALVSAMGAEGYNVLCNNGKAAGQLVDHVHFHIIPRKKGDGVFSRWASYEYEQGQPEQIVAKICERL